MKYSKVVQVFFEPSPIYHKVNPSPVRQSKVAQVHWFLKIKLQNISTAFNTNDFGKTFVLVFYNSFLKIESNCDKENMFISNTCCFQKKMLSNLTCFLIYSLTKCALEDGFEDICLRKILQNLQKYIHTRVYC